MLEVVSLCFEGKKTNIMCLWFCTSYFDVTDLRTLQCLHLYSQAPDYAWEAEHLCCLYSRICLCSSSCLPHSRLNAASCLLNFAQSFYCLLTILLFALMSFLIDALKLFISSLFQHYSQRLLKTDSRVPHPKKGILREQVPQWDWASLRPTLQHDCPSRGYPSFTSYLSHSV